jgi:hypothetical protein
VESTPRAPAARGEGGEWVRRINLELGCVGRLLIKESAEQWWQPKIIGTAVTFSAQNMDGGSRGSEGGVRRNLRVQSSCEVMKVVRGRGCSAAF